MSALTKICLLAIVSFSASALAQTTSAQTSKLQKQGEIVVGQIKGGETKTVLIALSAGQFATLRTEQYGSILLTSLFDPHSKEIIRMDNPAGGYGPIIISTIASFSGDYRLEVLSKDKWANPANFEVVLDELRSPQSDDQTVIDAQQAFTEGRKFFLSGQASDALLHYLRALELWTKAKNERWQALTHFALNQTYTSIGARERPKAIKELESLLAIANVRLAPNDWRIKAAALNDLGSHYTFTSEINTGFNYLKEALDLFVNHQDRRGQASALNNLAIAHGRTGNFSLARDLVQQALPLRYAENDKAGALNLINSLGAVSDRLGEPDKALEYFEKALQEWQKLGTLTPRDRARVAVVLQNLAVASDKLGQWGKAREYYDRALEMLSEGDPARVAALDSRGELYASLGEPEKARESYNDALALQPTEKFDPDLKAGILVHKGQLFSLQGDLANAVNSFEQARNLKPQRPKLADVLTNLAVALASQGKLEEAMAAFDEAHKIQVELNDKRGQALTLQKRGETYNLLKKHAEALDDLKRSLSLWEELKDPRGRAATLNTLAHVEDDSGNLRDALKYSDDVIAIVESQRTTLSSRQLRISYFATQESYYELNIDLNMRLSKSAGAHYVAQAFATAEKARARVLLEILMEAGVDRSENNKSSTPQQSYLLDQRRTYRTKLAAKAQARTRLLGGAPNSAQIAKLDQEIDDLSEKCDSLDAQIRSQHPRFANLTKPQPVTLQDTQQLLDQDTVLLEYALGNKRSYAWIVTWESIPGQNSIKGFELPPRDPIEKAAGRLIQALSDRSPNINESISQQKLRQEKAVSEASAHLSKLVLEQVAPLLDRKRLVVVPDGVLQLVSFGALLVPGDKTADTHLIAQHEIGYLPSASVLALQRRELANRKPALNAVAILANPVFGPDDYRVTSVSNKKTPPIAATVNTPQSHVETTRSDRFEEAMRDAGIVQLSPLPYSYDEAVAIINVAPKGKVFAALGFEANRSAAMNPKLSHYNIIHIATHGVLNLNRPESSAIVLSLVDKNGQPQDGYLFLDDIYNLHLPAELVVLSACQTGVGKQVKGEGLIALTRGFMYAGAASVVASLWKVDDAATAALMKQFYKEMFINGKRPAAALRAAQLHLREQRRWSSPAHWAGFFIQGEWK